MKIRGSSVSYKEILWGITPIDEKYFTTNSTRKEKQKKRQKDDLNTFKLKESLCLSQTNESDIFEREEVTTLVISHLIKTIKTRRKVNGK